MIKSIITGSGSCLPSRIIKNDYFYNASFWDKDGTPLPKSGKEMAEKMEAISGIKERRYLRDDQDSVDLLFEASENAIADAAIDKNEIGAIIIAHNSGNMLANTKGDFHPVPNMAAVLKHRLGIENYNCAAYDILFGCPGWVQGIIQANHIIAAGDAKHVLVAGVEVISRLLDPNDLDSMLMADGCGAVIVSAANRTRKGVLTSATFSHAMSDLANISLGTCLDSAIPGQSYFKMNGKEVYRYATTWLPLVIKKALEKSNLTTKDIDMFFFHQANGKMLEVIARNTMAAFGEENEPYAHKIPSIISFTGNTSVATVPTMFDIVKKGKLKGFKLKKGQKYVFASVGAGMHCNAVVYQN